MFRSSLLFFVFLCLALPPLAVDGQSCPTTIVGRSYPNIEQLRASVDYSAQDATGNVYTFNFCGPSISFPVCNLIAYTDVCQNGISPAARSCGVSTSTVLTSSYVSGTSNSLSFYSSQGTAGGACTAPRATNITVTCVPNSPTKVIGLVVESEPCLYLINMQSGAACPNGGPLDSSQSLPLTKLQALWGSRLGWTGDASSDGCGWTGVVCSQPGASGYAAVVGLSLSAMGLNGTLPDAIGSLTTLQSIDLSQNNFSGSIPASYLQLPKLATLALNNNALSGSIPDFPASSPIVSLSLQYNQLSGGLPSSLSVLHYLDNLYLQANQLSGSVPNFVCILSAYNLQRNLWDCPVPACCADTGNLLCLPCFSS